MLWVFDVNETLLDLTPLDAVFERHIGTPEARVEWFDLLIRSALVATATGGYRDFAKLGGACARAVARAHDAEFTEEAMGELSATMRTLPAHPEVAAALSAVWERGHRLVALANSPQAVVEAQLRHAGLAESLDAIYSVERAGMLKPAPAAYRLALDAEHVEPEHAVMVAAHDWDIAGAQAAGMRTVFVARGGRTPLPDWPSPDRIAADLTDATATDLTA